MLTINWYTECVIFNIFPKVHRQAGRHAWTQTDRYTQACTHACMHAHTHMPVCTPPHTLSLTHSLLLTHFFHSFSLSLSLSVYNAWLEKMCFDLKQNPANTDENQTSGLGLESLLIREKTFLGHFLCNRFVSFCQKWYVSFRCKKMERMELGRKTQGTGPVFDQFVSATV